MFKQLPLIKSNYFLIMPTYAPFIRSTPPIRQLVIAETYAVLHKVTHAALED